jgi:hypothetical protein
MEKARTFMEKPRKLMDKARKLMNNPRKQVKKTIKLMNKATILMKKPRKLLEKPRKLMSRTRAKEDFSQKTSGTFRVPQCTGFGLSYIRSYSPGGGVPGSCVKWRLSRS